jgi:hypothetical protein
MTEQKMIKREGFICRKHRYFPHSLLITGFVTRLTLRVPLVEQELLTLPEHLSAPPFFYLC